MSDGGDWMKWGIPLIVLGVLALVLIIILITRWYVRRPMYNGTARMDGKTIIITGSNTGIGKETALDLAKRGGRIIILCRDMVKGRAAAEEISKETNANIAVHELDLASLESVRSCAELLKEKESKIDVLINNAGVMTTPQWETKDGFEMQLGTNHLGHFLLTLLLIENLKAAAPSRIINVSSLAHMGGEMYWDDLSLKNNYTPIRSYNQSKLANVLFTRSLAKKLEGTGVTSYALHPGVVQTELSRHIGKAYSTFLASMSNAMMNIFSKTPLQGAQTSIYCAVEPSLEKETGNYYSGCASKRPSANARKDDDGERLWKWSLEAVGLPEDFSL